MSLFPLSTMDKKLFGVESLVAVQAVPQNIVKQLIVAMEIEVVNPVKDSNNQLLKLR